MIDTAMMRRILTQCSGGNNNIIINEDMMAVAIAIWKEAVVTEREECAKVCDSESSRAMWNWSNDLPTNKQFWNGGEVLASSCAESIRARKD